MTTDRLFGGGVVLGDALAAHRPNRAGGVEALGADVLEVRSSVIRPRHGARVDTGLLHLIPQRVRHGPWLLADPLARSVDAQILRPIYQTEREAHRRSRSS